MEEKLITIVVLPYSKAYILKMQLEAKKIECDLENINLIEGAASSAVRVKILEKDIKEAFPIVEELLGVKPAIEKPEPEKMEKHILVPVNFSIHSKKACKLAFNIASHLQLKVVLMHSYFNPMVHTIPYGDIYSYDSGLLLKMENAQKNANDKFQDFVSKMASEIGEEKWDTIAPEYIIKSGFAENDILSYSEKNHSQLIVMGSGGQDELGAVGTVAADIMYNARVPVLIVPEEMPEQELSHFSKVLYATNFDEKDFVALDKLMSILYPFDIKLICAHVGQPKGDGWDLAKLNGMRDILKEKYRSESFECRLIVGNDILNSLETFIENEEINILSLTTHKRNMISRLFNPSLAKRMLFHTHTPLLVFHA